VILGGVSSTTVTLNEQLGAPLRVQVTFVVPTENTDPEGGVQVAVPQVLPNTTGEKVTTAPHEVVVGEVDTSRLGGHVSEQVPAVTAVFAVAELLTGFGSLDMPLTVAMLVIVAPGAALTFTTSVIATDPGGAIGPSEQETVPVPPGGGVLQLPGLVSETNVVPAGMTSVKMTPVSVLGPLFVMPIV
jgi:hypothetical protein